MTSALPPGAGLSRRSRSADELLGSARSPLSALLRQGMGLSRDPIADKSFARVAVGVDAFTSLPLRNSHINTKKNPLNQKLREI